MKRIIFSLFLSLGIASFAIANDELKTLTVDTGQSTLEWNGYKVTGEHNGTIDLVSGELYFKDGQLSGGNFAIDMQSITVMDLDGRMKAKLEGHLKSSDFFSVEEFPKAKLNITDVVSRGKAGEYKILADLTIKGITKPIKFNAVENNGVFTADIKIDRSEYNVRYGSGSFFDNLGDKTIYDDFDLSVKLVSQSN